MCIICIRHIYVSTHFIIHPLSLHSLSQWISKCHQHYTETLRQMLQPPPTLRPSEFRGYFWTTGLNNGNLIKVKGSTETSWLNIDRTMRQPTAKYPEALNDQWAIYNQAQLPKEGNSILLHTSPPSPFKNSPINCLLGESLLCSPSHCSLVVYPINFKLLSCAFGESFHHP